MSRTVVGGAETLAWAIDGTLTSVTGPNGQATTFEYDATWAAAAAPRTGGPHLYLAGHEITANDAGTPLSAVRPSTFDGQLVATPSLAGVDFLISVCAGGCSAVPSPTTLTKPLR